MNEPFSPDRVLDELDDLWELASGDALQDRVQEELDKLSAEDLERLAKHLAQRLETGAEGSVASV